MISNKECSLNKKPAHSKQAALNFSISIAGLKISGYFKNICSLGFLPSPSERVGVRFKNLFSHLPSASDLFPRFVLLLNCLFV